MEQVIISKELFIENSPIKENALISKFIPFLLIAQKRHIRRVLGRALLTELQIAVKNNNLTDAQKALIIEIAPALSFYAVYEGLPFHWAAIQNKGVTVLNSENSDAVTLKDIAQLKRWLLDNADFFKSELISYLKACPVAGWAPHPLCGCESTPKQIFNSGFYFPKRR